MLKQATRAWFDQLSKFLLEIFFLAKQLNAYLFYNKINITTLILVYVDDIILARHSDELIQELVIKLEKEFALKDLGELHNFLGVEVRHFDRGIFLSQ